MNIPADDISAGPLTGLRVLDMGHQIAGPLCARMLADQGADVIKVERPVTGDVSRSMGPYVGSEPHPEKSLTYLYLNYNKRSLTIDLKHPEGREVLIDLVRKTDVLIENFEPRVMDGLKLGYQALAAINPRLVYASISNFGHTGPRRDWRGNDLIDYAASGMMSISGTADKYPLKHGYYQAGYVGGMAALAPIMAAVLMRDVHGQGQHIDLAISEALTSTLVLTIPYMTYMGETQTRRAPIGDTFGNCAPAKDGWVIAHAPRSGEWADFCDLVNEPALKDPKFSTQQGRYANAEELDRILGAALQRMDKFELFSRSNEKKVLFGVVQTPKDLADCPQLAMRGFFHEIDHPVAGRLRYPGQTWAASEAGFSIRCRPPLLGEHTEEILLEHGKTEYQINELRKMDAI